MAQALVLVLMGTLIGLGLSRNLATEAAFGVVLVGALGLVLMLLENVAGQASRRTAGEASYRAFFEQAVEGIFRTTPDGRYLVVNQALADIYGYSSPDVLIEKLTDISAQLYLDPQRRDAFGKLMQANDLVTDFVSEIRHSSGKRLWISENARAVRDWSGALICYEGTVQDVTGKFRAEQALRSALRQAELANRAKAAFLAAMSHELKTPLNAVLGFSEIIRDETLGEGARAAYRDYAADIHASGRRLLSVINDVLDVTRLEGGLLALDSRSVGAGDVAELAIGFARGATGDGREVAVEIEGMLVLHVDPRRLSQALGNLIANAFKFTASDGQIALTIRRSAGGVLLEVTDSGIGMAPDMVARALELFGQLDGSLARKFEGAGLGLPIARALTELHGGTLSIESAMGRGTVAAISLPASRLAQIAA